MSQPDRCQVLAPMPSLHLLPHPQRSRTRPRRSRRQAPAAPVDLLPHPDLDTQLCAIARELRRFDL